jgi:hypothetical protein
VHLRFHSILHFILAAALSCALHAAAQQGAAAQGPSADPQAAAAGQPAAAATLHGHITDQTGALIPGAKVTLTDTKGKVMATTTADSSGAYDFRGLKPGGYIVTAEFTGFAPFQSPVIAISAGSSKRVDVAMAIQVEQQNVQVTDESNTVNTEAAGNANALVLKGKDLDALSDDPDELANEISALAGPSAGPNGGQIFIDGFSGGQLPPKSAIREIRINQNPFSAEFDRLGYGRIEILTKPGTDKLHGQVFAMGNDSAFNTNHVFNTNGLKISAPSYYSYHFNGTVSGPINKNASFFVSVERRHIGEINSWLIPDAVLPNGASVDCPNGDAYCNVGPYNVDLPNTRVRTNSSARIDWQLGARNTLTARYGFWSESELGDLNAGSLAVIGDPSINPSWHESNSANTVQISDAFIINDRIVNETRAQYDRHDENHYPDSSLPTVSVMGYFTGGGLSSQLYRDHNTRLEFQNLTTMSHGAHAIKFGTRIRDQFLADVSTSNYNGTFRFATADAYLNMANGLASGKTFSQEVAAGNGPITVSYNAGPPSATANVFDVALFAQDDWKVSQRFTLSGGMRWESQNHISDHDDWAPRVGLAYALDGSHGKPAKTVLRAGFGVFYDRFEADNLLTVNHLDVQNKIVLNNPDCSSTATSLNAVDFTSCTSGPGAFSRQDVPVRYRLSPSFHAPYVSQLGASIERQIAKGTTATVTYLHSFGAHQLVTINANQFNPDLNNGQGGYPVDPTGGYLYEFFPEAVFKQNQIITSVNATVTRNFNVVGFYTAGWASSDGGAGSNASNAYNIGQDYGPATFNTRNRIFAMANYSGPFGLRFSPFMMANSGKPFDITLPEDPLNDFYNQRPGVASAAQCSSDPQRYYSTSYGCMDTAPALGEKLIPANVGVGPAAVAFNLRISRGFGFGPETSGPHGPSGGGGGWHGHGGPPGGSLGPGGLGGNSGGGHGMWGGGGPANRKYALTFSAQALNLFNNVDYGGPTGTIGSPYFLRSTTLAGGMYSSGSAVRRVFLQATFSF